MRKRADILKDYKPTDQQILEVLLDCRSLLEKQNKKLSKQAAQKIVKK